MAYITCKNVSLGYDGKTIVSNLNFYVKKGDYLCILGENGTGKSTLMKTLLGLQKSISGEILMGDDIVSKQIGYLSQQTSIQKDFPATVHEVVLSGTLSKQGLWPFYTKEQKKLVEEKMKELNIWELRKKCYRNLSGGQQQRVLLARALCASEKMIFLDEPVTGLDPKVTTEFYKLVEERNKMGLTVIMVSHDLQVLEYATHILQIKSDECFFGTKQQYIQSKSGIQFLKNGGYEECKIC